MAMRGSWISTVFHWNLFEKLILIVSKNSKSSHSFPFFCYIPKFEEWKSRHIVPALFCIMLQDVFLQMSALFDNIWDKIFHFFFRTFHVFILNLFHSMKKLVDQKVWCYINQDCFFWLAGLRGMCFDLLVYYFVLQFVW